VQGHLLGETHAGAPQPIELRAIGQGGEGLAQAILGVAVEVSFAREAVPPGKTARMITSLSERDASGPGLLFG
jgi:hypothetical protein